MTPVRAAYLAGFNAFTAAAVAREPARLLKQNKGLNVVCASDFQAAEQQNVVGELVQNVSQGLNNCTPTDVWAMGGAWAESIAGTTDGQQAIAIATATAFCEQGETADAFAEAFVVTIFCDETTGCKTLAMARSIAEANCSAIGDQAYAYSYADSYALSAALGHCKVAVPGAKKQLKNFIMPDGTTVGVTKGKLRKYLPKGSMASCKVKRCSTGH